MRWFISIPVETIFKKALLNGVFFSEWKKGNIVLIHKKSNKQSNKNCRPVSLSPICGKIFERVIFNEMFNYFFPNKLISKYQPGFQPGDSCINQLLSITHKIFISLDKEIEVRSLLLGISSFLFTNWNKTTILVNFVTSYLIF